MRTGISQLSLSTLVAIGWLAAQNAPAQVRPTPAPATPAAEVSAPVSDAPPPPAHLSYGVADVLKLSSAHVGEDAIISFVANSGTAYSLSVNEIIYLKSQGVSDRVITCMLDQRRRITEAAQAAPAAQAAATAPAYADPNTAASQYAPMATQPAPTSSQTVPASTVYNIPNTSTSYVYPSGYGYYGYPYYSYPYYGGYYGYGYPGVSLSLGFGGCWGGSCYRGGYWGGYRGGCYGGGWHGGYHR